MNISTRTKVPGPPLPLLRGSVPQSKKKVSSQKGHHLPSVVSERCSPRNVSLFASQATGSELSSTATLPQLLTDKHQKNMTEATGSQWAAEVSEGITFCACLATREENSSLAGRD